MNHKCIRIDPSFVPSSKEEYWARQATNGDPMEPLGKPCHDCAVTCGLYSELSDELATLPPEIIKAVSLRWWCHNNHGRACRGNIDRLDREPAGDADAKS